MAQLTRHKLDKIVLPSSVEINILKNQRWSAGINTFLERPGGHLHPMFVGTQNQQPDLSFSTPEIDTLLGSIGLAGASLGSLTTYFKLATNIGSDTRASTTHKKIVIASSLGYITSIRLSHGQPGEANVTLAAAYDGSNDPFVYTASVALSGNLAAGTYFGAGPVQVNGSAIEGIQEISIDTGVKIERAGANSEEFDTFIGVSQCEYVVTIKTTKLVNWATVLLRGLKLDGSNGLIFYGRKFTNALNGGVSRVADGTAQHLKFQGLNGLAIPISSGGDNFVTDEVKFILTAASDSVVPLTCNTASAIT